MFKNNPFFKIKKLKASWINDLIQEVNFAIGKIEESIKLEAESDGQPELADEKFLYKCFKENW